MECAILTLDTVTVLLDSLVPPVMMVFIPYSAGLLKFLCDKNSATVSISSHASQDIS